METPARQWILHFSSLWWNIGQKPPAERKISFSSHLGRGRCNAPWEAGAGMGLQRGWLATLHTQTGSRESWLLLLDSLSPVCGTVLSTFEVCLLRFQLNLSGSVLNPTRLAMEMDHHLRSSILQIFAKQLSQTANDILLTCTSTTQRRAEECVHEKPRHSWDLQKYQVSLELFEINWVYSLVTLTMVPCHICCVCILYVYAYLQLYKYVHA